MTKKTFILAHDTARQRAKEAISSAPAGYMVVISEPKRKDIQNSKIHAMIGDIAKQCTFMGKRWDIEDWKRLLIDAFAKAMRDAGTPLHHDGRVVPSLDSERVVQLGIQSRDFYVKEAAEFIEYLFSYGAENSIIWTEKEKEIPPEYMR